jgi:hypothetical protein
MKYLVNSLLDHSDQVEANVIPLKINVLWPFIANKHTIIRNVKFVRKSYEL